MPFSHGRARKRLRAAGWAFALFLALAVSCAAKHLPRDDLTAEDDDHTPAAATTPLWKDLLQKCLLVAVLSFVLLYVFLALAMTCEDYLVPSIEHVCAKGDIPDEAAGALLLAFGSSAPEIMMNASATLEGRTDLSLPAVLGSAMFAFGMIPALCVLTSPEGKLTLMAWPIVRDTTYYTFSLGALCKVLTLPTVGKWPSVLLVGVYFGYCAVVILPFLLTRYQLWPTCRWCRACYRDRPQPSPHPRNDRALRRAGYARVTDGSPERGSELGDVEMSVAQSRVGGLEVDGISGEGFLPEQHGRLREPSLEDSGGMRLRSPSGVPGGAGLELTPVGPAPPGPPHDPLQGNFYKVGAKDESGMPVIKRLSSHPSGTSFAAHGGDPPARGNGAGEAEDGQHKHWVSDAESGAINGSGPVKIKRSPHKRRRGSGGHQAAARARLSAAEDGGADGSSLLSGMDDLVDEGVDDDEGMIERVLRPVHCLMALTFPDLEKDSQDIAWWRVCAGFTVSLLWVGLWSNASLHITEELAHIMHVSDAMAGATFLALGSQVPDTITSVSMARAGMADGAISNAVGSQVINVSIGVGLPFLLFNLLKDSPVPTEGGTAGAMLLGMCTLAVIMVYCCAMLPLIKWITGREKVMLASLNRTSGTMCLLAFILCYTVFVIRGSAIDF